jgi:hypothetical protein
MKLIWNLGVSVALLVFVAVAARAADKEATLKGKISCAKCELKLPGVKKCQTVIQVQEDGKEVTYFFLDKGNKEEYHEAVCGGGKKDGTVTGTVSEKDGKKWIKPSKVEYAGGADKQAMKGPMWMTDYATALKCSRQEHKPLAIFIGCGKDGWKNVVRGGKLGKDVEDMLGKEFVCLYLDAETPAGKHSASILKVSGDMGLVLGDRNGEYIEDRRTGAMSESELSGCLSRCCGMTMNGQNGMKMNGQNGKGMSNGMRGMNGSMGAAMQAPAGGSCCSGR